MKLYIKYMIGLQCKARVMEELHRLNIPFNLVDAGMVELSQDLSVKQRDQLKFNLLAFGYKLHDAKKCILVEKIKSVILEMIEYGDGQPVIINSVYLSLKLNHDYTYLANVFSEVTGMSIQQFIIISKIDKVKELLFIGELNLSEISFLLHYSSLAHLSGQFKKITGLSPTSYKLMMKTGKEKLKAN